MLLLLLLPSLSRWLDDEDDELRCELLPSRSLSRCLSLPLDDEELLLLCLSLSLQNETGSTSEYKKLMTRDRVRVGHTDYCYCCFYVLWMSWSCFCGRCCAPYHDACPCWTIYVCCCCCHFCCYDGDHDHDHWWSHHSIALRRSCFRHFARVDSGRKFREKNTNVS